MNLYKTERIPEDFMDLYKTETIPEVIMTQYKNRNNSRSYGPMIHADVNVYIDNIKWQTQININIDEEIYTSETLGSPQTHVVTTPQLPQRALQFYCGLCHRARESLAAAP
jgi:hypothetical protein